MVTGSIFSALVFRAVGVAWGVFKPAESGTRLETVWWLLLLMQGDQCIGRRGTSGVVCRVYSRYCAAFSHPLSLMLVGHVPLGGQVASSGVYSMTRGSGFASGKGSLAGLAEVATRAGVLHV